MRTRSSRYVVVAAEPEAEADRGFLTPALLLSAAGGVGMGFGRLTFAYLLEPMKQDIFGSYSLAGVVGAANLAGSLVGVAAANALLRRRPATHVLNGSLLLACLSLIAIAAAPLWPLTLIAAVVLGFAGGLVWIACIPVMSATTPPDRRGLTYGIVVAGIGISIVLTGAIVHACNAAFGEGVWRQVWAAEGILGLVLLICLHLFMAPSPGPGPTPVPTGRRRPSVPRGIGWPTALYLFWGLTHGLYSNYLVAAAQTLGHMSAGEATAAYSVLGLANIVGGMVLGRLSDGWGRRRLMVASLVLIVACAWVVPLGLTALVFASAAVYGLIMSGLPSVLVASLADRLTPVDLSTTYAVITVAVGLGQLVGVPVGGLLADRTGSFAATFVTSGACALVALCCAARFPDRRRDHAGELTRRTG